MCISFITPVRTAAWLLSAPGSLRLPLARALDFLIVQSTRWRPAGPTLFLQWASTSVSHPARAATRLHLRQSQIWVLALPALPALALPPLPVSIMQHRVLAPAGEGAELKVA